MWRLLFAVFVLAGMATLRGQTVSLNFNGGAVAEGSTLGAQYPGVTFTPNVVFGPSLPFYGVGGSPLGRWATNTDLTVTATDLSLMAGGQGLVVHAFGNVYPGYLSENGDANFSLSSAVNLASITVTFSGLSNSGSAGIADFAGGLIGAKALTSGTDPFALEDVTLNFPGAGTSAVLIVPGSFSDWVSVVAIRYTLVPEPRHMAWVALASLGAVAFARCRRRGATGPRSRRH